MAKWIDYSVDERNALIAKVAKAKNIDDAAAEKDWWVTAVLYAVFHTSIAEYSLFKGGTSLSKGWDIISRFSEDIDIALERSFYMNEKGYACAECATMTQIRNLREKFYHPSYVDYSKELPQVIDFLPPAAVVDAFRDDYNDMMGSFIYEKTPLDFDELLSSVAAIREQFRKCVTSK